MRIPLSWAEDFLVMLLAFFYGDVYVQKES